MGEIWYYAVVFATNDPVPNSLIIIINNKIIIVCNRESVPSSV